MAQDRTRARVSSPRSSTVLVVFAVALLLHGAIQLAMPGFADRDAWFHSRYAALLAAGNAAWDGSVFPWITQSAFAERPMDWSLLWHWLLAPFASMLGPVPGMKTFAAFQAALLTATFFAVLRARHVRAPVAWTALLLAASPQWLFRLHFGRPTPLVVVSLLVVFHAVLARRRVLAAGAVALSLLLYQVPAPVALVAGSAWLGRCAAERRPDWRAAGALAGGGVAGVLLHPGLWSGATLHVWRLMAGSLEVAAAGGGVQLSNGMVLRLALPDELGSPGIRGMFGELWPSLATTSLAVAIVGIQFVRRRSRRPPRAAAVAGAVLAAAGLVATWQSGRFFEYWHVFALLAVALAVSSSTSSAPWWLSSRRVVGTLALVLGLLSTRAMLPLINRLGDDGGRNVAPALAAVHTRSERGDVVWHLSWDDFAPLFHFAPDLRYVRGMDPWWCVVRDPEGAIAHAMVADAAVGGAALRELLVARFDARFVVLWSQEEDGPAGVSRRERLAARLDAAPWATRIYRDAATTAYELTRP